MGLFGLVLLLLGGLALGALVWAVLVLATGLVRAAEGRERSGRGPVVRSRDGGIPGPDLDLDWLDVAGDDRGDRGDVDWGSGSDSDLGGDRLFDWLFGDLDGGDSGGCDGGDGGDGGW